MTESTFDLVRPYFEGTALEPVRVKGIQTPLSVIRLEYAVESKATANPGHAAPFIGRRTEKGQMTAALESCLHEGGGQTLFVRGEAGVGKSRLVQEVEQTADSLGFTHHSAFVLDFGSGKDQDPVSALMQSLLQLPKHPTNEQEIGVVERSLADATVLETEAAFVFDLLDAPKPAQLTLEFEAMDPERRRRGRRDVFRDIVVRLSRRRPSLIVVEDIHYADEITLDYLRELMRATFEVPLVLVMTTRPSQDPLSADWQSIVADAPITIISLGPLRESESQRLAAAFKGLQHSTIAACIERSDGNPLFLIELLRAAQRGLLDSMPTSVQTIAVARLDELKPDDREAIQAAAILGQRFELETLRGLLGRSDYEPTSLIDAQFIRQERDDCLFNHGLIKDAVVGTLLRSNLQRLHQNAAAWFEDRDLGLCAFHLEHAGDPSASEAYETAARAEATRFRFDQALAFIDRAIAINDEVKGGSRLEHLRGEYLLGIGATQRAAEAFTSAATQATEPEVTCRARIGLAHALRDLGEYDRGIEVLSSAQGDAERAGLTRELAEIFHHRGNIKQLEIDAEGCREANTEALRYARESGSPELEALALGGLARASVMSGRFKSEQRYAGQCIEICRDNGLEQIEFTFRHFLAVTAFYSADLNTACREFKACVERGPEVGALRPAMIANLGYGEVLLEMGNAAHASQYLDESERLSNVVGEPRYFSCILALRARIAWSSGEPESASAIVEDALSGIGAADERWGKLYLLGALARLTKSSGTRLATLEEGAQICGGPCWGIGAVRFLWDAMNASLAAKEWQQAISYAEALERFSEDEPMELFDLLIARTRAIASHALTADTRAAGKSIEQIRRSIKSLGLVDDSAALEGISTEA